MPPPEEMYLQQRALLWEFVRYDSHSEPVVDRPVEIWVRWNNTQSDMMDANGNKVTVDATVKSSREIAVDSIMWEGGFDDIAGTGTGSDQVPESDLMQVKMVQESKDLRGIVTGRQYGLMFFRNTMPEIVDG